MTGYHVGSHRILVHLKFPIQGAPCSPVQWTAGRCFCQLRAALGPETSRVLWCALGDGRARSRAENAKGTLGTALRALKMRLGLGQKSAPASLPEDQPEAETGLDAAAAAMAEREHVAAAPREDGALVGDGEAVIVLSLIHI